MQQRDELDDAPEYVFLPARPPSVRERSSIHNTSCFARALTHDSCAPSVTQRASGYDMELSPTEYR